MHTKVRTDNPVALFSLDEGSGLGGAMWYDLPIKVECEMTEIQPDHRQLRLPSAQFAIALLLLVACVVLGTSTAFAQTYGSETGTLDVSQDGGAAATSVRLAGSGFAPGSNVNFSLLAANGADVIDLGEASADSDGEVDWESSLPSDLEDGAYEVRAEGVTLDGASLLLTGDVEVGAAGEGESSDTGSSVWWWVGGGVLLLAAAGVTARSVAARR